MRNLSKLHKRLEMMANYPEYAAVLAEYYAANRDQLIEADADGVYLYYEIFWSFLRKLSQGKGNNLGGRTFEFEMAAAFNLTALRMGSNLRILVLQSDYEKHFVVGRLVEDPASREYSHLKNGLDWVMVENPPISADSVQADISGRIVAGGLSKTSVKDRKKQESDAIQAADANGVFMIFSTIGDVENGETSRGFIEKLPDSAGLFGIDLVLSGSREAEGIEDPRIMYFVHMADHPSVERFVEFSEGLSRSQLAS